MKSLGLPKIKREIKTEDVIKDGKLVDRIHHLTETWEFDIITDPPKQKKIKKKK